MADNDKAGTSPGRTVQDREPRTLLPMLIAGLVLIMVGMLVVAYFV